MADVTLAGAPVLAADLILPRIGNHSAHLTLSADAAPTGAAVLRWLGTDLQGTILHSGDSEGSVSALWVGGAGQLGTVLQAQHYSASAVRLPLSQAVEEAGERLSATSTASAMAVQLDSWPRLARPLADELDALARAAGAVWRVLPDGTIWFGVETWPAAGSDFTLEREDHAAQSSDISPGALAVLPGQSMGARRIGHAVYTIAEDAARARLWWQSDEGAEEDPIRAGLASIIDERIRLAGVDYLALYPARVVVQRSDGTLDVQPDSPRIPPMTERPYRGPVHGARLTIPAGARVLVGFASADLRAAYCLPAYEPGGGGHKAAARVDDLVVANTSMQAWIAAAQVVLTAAATLTMTPAPTAPTDFGKISTGSPHLSLLPGSTP